MASTRDRDRDRDDPLSFTTNPSIISSSSSPVSVSDPRDSFLSDPSNSHLGSASGSFQNEGLLSSDFNGGSGSGISDVDFGFSRSDFRQNPLVGTVDFYDRHLFLCYKNPKNWPPRIEAAEFDRLPRLLSAAVMARKSDMMKETRLTICEGHDGTETSNGDVLIFPDMIRYRRLTHFDVDTFVEEVLVKNGEWQPGTPEKLKGSYVFVCCHASRDRRCGVCGPILLSRFKEEIKLLGLENEVSVSPCSHVGGDKYAGNVIIFGPNSIREVSGHWYGYVSPEDVHLLLQHHIVKGKIVDELWRGQMGLSEEEQKISLESRLRLNGGTNGHQNKEELAQIQTSDLNTDTDIYRSRVDVAACCQGEGYSSCCQNPVQSEKTIDSHANDIRPNVSAKSNRKHVIRINSGKGASRKVCAMPTWLESWEREDTYAVVAVMCAVVSVAVAYSCYKQL